MSVPKKQALSFEAQRFIAASLQIGDPAVVLLDDLAKDVDQLSDMPDIQSRSKHLFNNDLLSDAVFLVDGRRIPVHSLFLRSASCVFDAMFSHNWKRDEDIEITDFSASPFLSLLRWIYCSELVFEEDCLLDVMRLASKYLVNSLLKSVSVHLNQKFIWSIVAHAMEYGDKERQAACWKLIASKTQTLVALNDFQNCPTDILQSLTSFDSLSLREIELFEACYKWSEAECTRQGLEVKHENQRQVMDPFLKQFAFQTMKMDEFAGHPCDILTEAEQSAVFRFIAGKLVATPFRTMRKVVAEGEQPEQVFPSLDTCVRMVKRLSTHEQRRIRARRTRPSATGFPATAESTAAKIHDPV